MNASEYGLPWLIETALFGFIILAAGAAAACWRRAPVERLRLIEWTFLGCLLAVILHAAPGIPRLSFGVLDRAPANTEIQKAVAAQAEQEGSPEREIDQAQAEPRNIASVPVGGLPI